MFSFVIRQQTQQRQTINIPSRLFKVRSAPCEWKLFSVQCSLSVSMHVINMKGLITIVACTFSQMYAPKVSDNLNNVEYCLKCNSVYYAVLSSIGTPAPSTLQRTPKSGVSAAYLVRLFLSLTGCLASPVFTSWTPSLTTCCPERGGVCWDGGQKKKGGGVLVVPLLDSSPNRHSPPFFSSGISNSCVSNSKVHLLHLRSVYNTIILKEQMGITQRGLFSKAVN